MKVVAIGLAFASVARAEDGAEEEMQAVRERFTAPLQEAHASFEQLLNLVETAIDYRDELARETDRRAQSSREEFVAQGGTIQPLTDAQRRVWADSLPNMAKEWAEDLEERGLPGRQILRDYMDVMRANNQPIVRHWDREL